jgi:hypothetical protein
MTAEAPTQGLTTDSRVQNLESSLNEACLIYHSSKVNDSTKTSV